MMDYQLEIKQVVDYPRCRVYREFIQSLIADRSIRTNGCSGLFLLYRPLFLCKLQNFLSCPDGITYTIYPGEWICRLSELSESLRLHTRRQSYQCA